MIQSKKMHPLLFSFLLLSPALITACSDQKEPYASHPKQTNDPTHDLKAQIEAKPIKTFKSTVHDLDDIALLSEYEQNFNAISTDLEAELEQLKKDGNLTEEMNNQRKRDLIQSSLNMLKELDLKTEQGRYIQGLFYQYWESQSEVYTELTQSNNQELQNPTDAVKNMSDYYTAKAQLEHWRAVSK